jgi:hypothetical protein
MAHLFGYPSVCPSGSIRPLVAADHLLRWYRSVDGASTDKAKLELAHYLSAVFVDNILYRTLSLSL